MPSVDRLLVSGDISRDMRRPCTAGSASGFRTQLDLQDIGDSFALPLLATKGICSMAVR
jgi:hypothetical protein